MGKKVQPRSALHHERSKPPREHLKIGLIVEGTIDGPDKKVCDYLVRRLQQGIEVVTIPLGSKRNLTANCGKTAALLLGDRNCERVVIVWDLYPPVWDLYPPSRRREKPCRRDDRKVIFSSLQEAGVAFENVHLVCIREELEAWLIADNRAVAAALLGLTGRVSRITEVRRPDSVSKPKERLMRIFREHAHRQYQGYDHAIKIIRELPNSNKIRRSESFTRFALKAADRAL